LLGLVSQAAGLVRAGGLGASDNGGELPTKSNLRSKRFVPVFPATNTQQEAKRIRLLFLPKFCQIFVRT
jgi:hypothetical protein